MNILWIINTIFPYPAKRLGVPKENFGGWLNGLAENIINNQEIELAIATTYSGSEVLEYKDSKITYFLIPGGTTLKYNVRQEEYWKKINEDFKPDLVHIHGTEYAHGLSFLNACPEVRNVVSIQGLVYRCAEVYFGNISSEIIKKNITFRDVIKQDNLFQQKKKFEQRGRNEIEIIKKANAILGRTTWDYANTNSINQNAKYYKSNETLRKTFYKKGWNIDNIERHTLFCSQASYPIKGFHYLIEAVDILKRQYPDIKLYVAGPNVIDDSSFMKKIKMTGYAKYLSKLIKKYNLQEQIMFTGLLNEEQMVEKLLSTHVFVLPSVIENSSNSLGEAMLIGMPCVASNTGGTMDILEHKKEGYVYPYTEPAMCAEYISKIFKNDELAKTFGQKARVTALERHNPEKNVKSVVEIYKKVIGEK